MRHLVGERQQVGGRLDVADRPVHIDRLDRVPTGEVDHLEHLAQLEQVAEGLASAGAAHAVEADDVRWAADGAEGDVVATDGQGVRRVPRVHLELSGACADQLDDHLRVEANALAVDRRPGSGEPLARSGVEEVHPDLGEDAQRRVVDRLQLVRRDDLGRLEAHARLAERALFREAGTLTSGTSTPAATSRSRCLHLGHFRYERTAYSGSKGDRPEGDDGESQPDRLRAGEPFVVQLGRQHDRARRVHRGDHGDERQQSFPGGQQVADVGDDGEGAGAEGEAARPADRADAGARDERRR